MAKDYEWRSWNPVTGCTKISAGCMNCYAEKLATHVQSLNPQGKYKNGFKLTLHPEYLDVPLKFKMPKTFFVNSMTDIFHKDVPDDFLIKIFSRMQRGYWHTYNIITKRPERMRVFINETVRKTLPNLWLGVSIENAKVVNRLDELKQTNAKRRFVNFAPLIGPVGTVDLAGIDWVYIGGERGFSPRPMKNEWADEILEQCKKASVSCSVYTGRNYYDPESMVEPYDEYPGAVGQTNILQYVNT